MLNNKSGYTLAEILIVIGILLMVIFVSAEFISTGYKAINFSNEQEIAIKIARRAMADITVEVRGANTSEQGDYPLSVVDDDEFVFFADTDDDSVFEKIRYFTASSTLYKVVTEPGSLNNYTGQSSTTTVATYVNNQEEDIFIYFDDNYNETDVINSIRLIKIVLKINVTPQRAPNDVYIESDVNLRNLKDNL